MSWAKLDDHFPTHPKVLAAGGDAAWLFVCALCYCAEHLTDGRFPRSLVPRLSDRRKPEALAARLVEVGLWLEDGDDYLIHDYLAWNPSREHVEREREAARERRQRGGRTSAERRANVGDASDDARANDINPVPVPVPEVPTEPSGAHSAPAASNGKRGTRIPEVWSLTDERHAWCDAHCPDIDRTLHTQRFVNYWKAKSGRDAVKLDWERTWQNWMLQEQDRVKHRGPARTYL